MGAALALTACNADDLTKVNNNPNNPTVAPPNALFTNAVRVGVGRWLGSGFNLRALSLTAQHLAEVQYPDTDAYRRLKANFTNTTFDLAYAQELEDLTQVIKAGEANATPLLYGPALVMRTWGFSHITDAWGDVPYFSALKGDEGGSLSPEYDLQEAIYADFFVLLARATADMAAAPSNAAGYGASDPIYAGNRLRWQKFSNSLRARLAMRLVNVVPALARTQFEAAVNAPGGLMVSNADNAQLAWPGDGVYDNPWATNFKTRDDHRLSDRLMSVMQGSSDPRIPIYAQPTPADPTRYAGMPNALTHAVAQSYFNISSRPGAAFYPGATVYGTFGGAGGTYPSYLMTYAEVSFLKAEAAERGWTVPGGTAASFYAEGIQASMAQWGVTSAAAIAAFIANPAVAYTPGAEGLRRIATQKWVALYSNGPQAWAEWRRTCAPSNVRPGPDALVPYVPRRLEYSITENAVNAAAVAAAVASQGADTFATRMYWDSSPAAAPTYVNTATCGP